MITALVLHWYFTVQGTAASFQVRAVSCYIESQMIARLKIIEKLKVVWQTHCFPAFGASGTLEL